MDLANLTRFEAPLCEYKKQLGVNECVSGCETGRFVKFEDVKELLKQADNSLSDAIALLESYVQYDQCQCWHTEGKCLKCRANAVIAQQHT